MQEKSTNEYIRTSKGKNDECYTHRYAVEPLLEFLKAHKEKRRSASQGNFNNSLAPAPAPLIIWCPFDTEESEFVKVLKENGYKVIYSHIDYGQDFYKYEPEHFDLIISNPPFTNKTKMFKRILSFNKPFAILMSVLYLNDGTPYSLFKDIDLQLLLFPKRMTFKGQTYTNKINFMSCYFCKDFLPKQIIFRDFVRSVPIGQVHHLPDFHTGTATNTNQLNLFKEGEQ